MARSVKTALSACKRWLFADLRIHQEAATQSLIGQEIVAIHDRIRQLDERALILWGRKVYSQCDEDGIIEEIFNRIGTKDKVFVELGCGDGLENNTHYLLLKGWRGVWVDGGEANIRQIKQALGYREGHKALAIVHRYIDRDNIGEIIGDALAQLGHQGRSIDFLSIDIDGNDLEVLEHIDNVSPRVLCVEYNAKFPPGLALSVAYDPAHWWKGDDYHGSSLTALQHGLEPRGYVLVACNVAGTNAFFVRRDDVRDIEVPLPDELYMPARFHLVHWQAGHRPSLKFLARVIQDS